MERFNSILIRYKEYLLLLAIFTLPTYKDFSHWAFGIFMGLCGLHFILNPSGLKKLKNFLVPIILMAAFLLIKIAGLATASTLEYGFKEVNRALPFLLYPVAIFSISRPGLNFKEFETKAFYMLSFGCLLTALICWADAILSLKPGDTPANMLFGWKKSGKYLTSVLDVHPPYLGMLLVGSIVFLVREFLYRNFTIKIKALLLLLIAVLFVFLFNATARNAMIFLLLAGFIYMIFKKNWKWLMALFFGVVLINVVIIIHPSEYYRIKMYDMLGLTESDNKDTRFKRLEYSYNVFMQSPLFGVGMGNDTELKVEEYIRGGDTIAAKKQLNSHNQFFEYLVAFGVLGGALFLLVNAWLAYKFINARAYFYLILLFNIIVAGLSESIFERVLGIQYFTFIISFAFLSIYHKKIMPTPAQS